MADFFPKSFKAGRRHDSQHVLGPGLTLVNLCGISLGAKINDPGPARTVRAPHCISNSPASTYKASSSLWCVWSGVPPPGGEVSDRTVNAPLVCLPDTSSVIRSPRTSNWVPSPGPRTTASLVRKERHRSSSDPAGAPREAPEASILCEQTDKPSCLPGKSGRPGDKGTPHRRVPTCQLSKYRSRGRTKPVPVPGQKTSGLDRLAGLNVGPPPDIAIGPSARQGRLWGNCDMAMVRK